MKIRIDLYGNWFAENLGIQLFYPENKFILFLAEDSRVLEGTFDIFSEYIILKTSSFTSITFKIIEKTEDNFILENLSFNLGSKINLKKGLYELRNIKQFDFGDLVDVSLQEFKEIIEIEEISLNRAKDINGQSTKYYRYWNNDGRFCIILDEETTKHLKNNPSEKINVYTKIKKTDKDFYTNFFISLYKGSTEEYNYNRDMKEMYNEERFNDFEGEAFRTAFESNSEVWDNYNLR